MTGTIKSLLADKGFGFISPSEGGKDVFFHTSEVVGMQFADLRVGDMVSFELTDSPKGPKASHVTRA
ncbi:MAG: cold shock domain-containing protein [Candidatus Magasanikbacteria bacterium]|nr:cold shock domain-containing protein [Candidatus Magasanikbacteria bacterium]